MTVSIFVMYMFVIMDLRAYMLAYIRVGLRAPVYSCVYVYGDGAINFIFALDPWIKV